eukprot:CAMPEP_0206280910 /NCGR_PEP_ID=MMETSP0047_2-20121206/38836_1 /ASSEMBLY_ACC=CAM_ASM_000192 /TAXON_ID=195065 /ORGANISM="Chroomonas mesostigmatica_cf, Strain CCMP1168" /LENGTH=189 /DNA_ID=CAMNT_0053711015 /DNA_START=198 /DNA_END=767 /DNA_ORIENTATION=-
MDGGPWIFSLNDPSHVSCVRIPACPPRPSPLEPIHCRSSARAPSSSGPPARVREIRPPPPRDEVGLLVGPGPLLRPHPEPTREEPSLPLGLLPQVLGPQRIRVVAPPVQLLGNRRPRPPRRRCWPEGERPQREGLEQGRRAREQEHARPEPHCSPVQSGQYCSTEGFARVSWVGRDEGGQRMREACQCR